MEDPLWAKLAVNSMSAVRRQSGTTDRIKPNRKLIPLLCGGFICWALSSLAQPAMAGEAKSLDGSYGALAEFARQIGTAQAKPAQLKSSDELYSALSQFAQEVGTAPFKLAAAEKSKPNPWDVTGTATPKASAKKSSGGDGADDAIFVGSKVCLGCHASQAAAFEQTLMGRIGKVQTGKMECENCHGAGSAHAKAGGGRGVGGIISFRVEDKSRPVEANNAICLNCHENGHRTYWNGSTHETRGLACTNCHQVMKRTSLKNQMKFETEAQTCFQCHKDRQAQMWSSAHMPTREGKMTCSDCHNPHGAFTEALLKENSVNDTCYKCHADKRGPFLWEHYPVRDSCTNCHRPHGSNNEKMLKMMVPRLCAQCHTAGHGSAPLGNPAAVQSFNRGCLNCHTKIHGSNAPGGILFQR
jgi:DmsE family decaheme c-type cytochrome